MAGRSMEPTITFAAVMFVPGAARTRTAIETTPSPLSSRDLTRLDTIRVADPAQILIVDEASAPPWARSPDRERGRQRSEADDQLVVVFERVPRLDAMREEHVVARQDMRAVEPDVRK